MNGVDKCFEAKVMFVCQQRIYVGKHIILTKTWGRIRICQIFFNMLKGQPVYSFNRLSVRLGIVILGMVGKYILSNLDFSYLK